jgi:hypothetical protein
LGRRHAAGAIAKEKDTTMENEVEPDEATVDAERAEATHAHTADRAPTGEEEAAAERSADELAADSTSVAEHEKEMTDIGAHVKGEGSID